jgi:hypothetical protein
MPDDATAETAEVSRKTVFTAVDGEVELRKLALDWSVVGDDDKPAPLGDWPRCGKSGRRATRPGSCGNGRGSLSISTAEVPPCPSCSRSPRESSRPHAGLWEQTQAQRLEDARAIVARLSSSAGCAKA